MRQITQDEFDAAYQTHKQWLKDPEQGKRLELPYYDLRSLSMPKLADFSKADFEGADLSYLNLEYANFKGSNCEGANLQGARLCRATLCETNLVNANLSNTILDRATIIYSNLHNAKGIFTFSKMNGRICYAVVYASCLMVQAGCFWGKIDAFEYASKLKYPDDPMKAYAPQIAYLRDLEKSIYQKK